MLKADFERAALRFLKKLPPKHGRQIGLKIVELCRDPAPHDSQELKGRLARYRRADIGEYRIIYFVDEGVLRIPIIGKRNDGAVYKQMARKLK